MKPIRGNIEVDATTSNLSKCSLKDADGDTKLRPAQKDSSHAGPLVDKTRLGSTISFKGQ